MRWIARGQTNVEVSDRTHKSETEAKEELTKKEENLVMGDQR